MTKTVLITGACGNLGRKLREHFARLGWTLRLLDLQPDPDTDRDVVRADLSEFHDDWARAFRDVDAVIHLAAHASPTTSWADAVHSNIDLTQNVYEAAARHGAKRLIFASSNWTMAGYRFDDGPLTTDQTPFPINPYGVSKLIGERLGRSYHERWGLSVICFRIGYCQKGENRPGPQMGMNGWGQAMWLSNRDFCHGHERAVLADGVGFAVLNLMSDNPGMRWDIDATRRAIGYAPQDGAAPMLTETHHRDEDRARRLRAASVDLDHLFADGHA